MNSSTPGLPVHNQQLESTQTHIHPVSDAIQPSHPLSSPSPPAFNLIQHQGLLQQDSSHQVARVLECQLQHQSFQWIFRTDCLSGLISFRMDWWSPCSPTNCQQSSPTPQFKTIHPSMGTGYFLFYLLETIQLPCTFIFEHLFLLYWLCQSLWLCGSQ